MKNRKSLLILFLLIALDQLSKFVISSKMTVGQSLEIVPGFFNLTYLRNTGAGFSLFEGQRSFFLIITVLAIAIFVHQWKRCNENKILEKTSYLILIAGTMGNFIDRLLFGSVVDFLDFYLGNNHFPVFNFADILLTLGVLLLLFISWKGGQNNV